MKVKKVIQAGDPRLKSENKEITYVNSPSVKRLIKNLCDSMDETGLIGIAAPQIAENYMVFVTHVRNTKSRKLQKADTMRVYINPIITHLSEQKSIIYEGCGSVGDIFGPVERPKEITVAALDGQGKKFTLKCDGILARVIQHEYDHLKGVEFIEKVCDYSKIISQDHYRKHVRNSREQLMNSKITTIEITQYD